VTTLQLAVILLSVLCVLNTVAVVALIRQVGVLHLRIRPVAGMPGGGGPPPGSELALPGTLRDLTHSGASRFVIGFVSPTCGICGPLTTAFAQIGKSAAADTAVLLVLDATEDRAVEYLHGKGIDDLPYVADRSSFAANEVPGAPWAVISDDSGTVIRSAAVNTLDNIEEMIALADGPSVDAPLPDPGVDRPTIQTVEA
jgi:hypothetical protein